MRGSQLVALGLSLAMLGAVVAARISATCSRLWMRFGQSRRERLSRCRRSSLMRLFTYSAAALRHPFQPPVKLDLAQRQKGSKDIQPDESRVKQFLEGFNIENFTMVGTLSNGQGRYALIREGTVFIASGLVTISAVTMAASSRSAKRRWM